MRNKRTKRTRKEEDYTEIKHKYNQLLLSKENKIWFKIMHTDDSIKECIKIAESSQIWLLLLNNN